MAGLGRGSLDWDATARLLGGQLGGSWKWSPFGPDGIAGVERRSERTCIVSVAPHGGETWVHASVAHPDHLPSYHTLVGLHDALWPDGFAFQVFAPPHRHVNIHVHALHLWGRLDGGNPLPDFGAHGTI